MSGDQTHGYDAVIEFDEDCLKDAISKAIDGQDGGTGLFNNFYKEIGSYFSSIGHAATFPNPNLNFIVSLKIPENREQEIGVTDLPSIDLAPEENNYVYVMATFDINLLGFTVKSWVEMVIGFDIGPYYEDVVGLRVNLTDKHYYFDIGLKFNILGVDFLELLNKNFSFFNLKNWIVNNVIKINQNYGLFPLPIKSESINPYDITKAEIKIIRLTNHNFLALLLTMGGGNVGQKTAFNESAITFGDMVVLVSTTYFCRVINFELQKDNSFIGKNVQFKSCDNGCELTNSVLIQEDLYLDLLKLETNRSGTESVHNYEYSVTAGLSKKGFCYEAKCSIKASLNIGISSNGELEIKTLLDLDPDNPESLADIEIEMPWYCVVVSSLLFGILAVAFYFFMLWLAEDIVESVIDKAVSKLNQSINNMNNTITTEINEIPNAKTLILGFDSVLQSAKIDDLGMGHSFRAEELATRKLEVDLTIRKGSYLDLDNGKISSELDADLVFDNLGRLSTVSSAEATLISGGALKDIARYNLYKYETEPNKIIYEKGDKYPKNASILTNDGRMSIVQIVSTNEDVLNLKIRTYDNVVNSGILGNISCDYVFEEIYNEIKKSGIEKIKILSEKTIPRKNVTDISLLRNSQKDLIYNPVTVTCEKWTSGGIFRAFSPDLQPPVTCQWFINDMLINSKLGIFKTDPKYVAKRTVGSGKVDVLYKWENTQLLLMFDNPELKELNIKLKAHIEDSNGKSIDYTRYIQPEICEKCVSQPQHYRDYILKARNEWGLNEILIKPSSRDDTISKKDTKLNFDASTFKLIER